MENEIAVSMKPAYIDRLRIPLAAEPTGRITKVLEQELLRRLIRNGFEGEQQSA
jgi:hypothetical protein